MASTSSPGRVGIASAILCAVLVAACSVNAPSSAESSATADLPSVSGATTTPGPSTTPEPGPSASGAELSGEIRWTRVATPFGDPNVGERIDGLVTWPSGLVAYGRVKVPGRNQFNDLAAIFLSETGESWRTVPIDVGVGPVDTSEIYLVVAGPRSIVLFGDTCCAVEEHATWWSADGDTWERVPFPSTSVDGPQLTAGTATAGLRRLCDVSSTGTAPSAGATRRPRTPRRQNQAGSEACGYR